MARSLLIKDHAPTFISYSSILAIHSEMISLGFITPDTMRVRDSVALRQDEYPKILFLVRSEIVTPTKPPIEKTLSLNRLQKDMVAHIE